MKKINELKADINEVVVYQMPQLKLIGKEMRSGGVLGNRAPELWQISIDDGSLDVIKQLPRIIPDAILGWTGNYTKEDETYSYIVGALVPMNTIVPKGFAFRIIPETLVAKGIYDQGFSMVEVYKKMGYTQNYELYGWNAELYFETDHDKTKWTNITPVKKIEY
ncbi:hypothetical protein PV797_14440 [Clostridiaceae bacterium M8S5]|nr:hypothetical protein PV797_14440 [Clostridiaceae bacterium M8S5]